MKLSASTPAEQRRQYLLLGVLAVVALGVVYTQWGGDTTSEPPAASNLPVTTTPAPATTPPATGGSSGSGLPEPLQLAALASSATQQSGARNPFGFGSSPAPPPPPASAAPPPAPVRPPPPPQPTGPPPLPPIPVKFLGFAEDPDRPGKIVALGVAGGVVVAREGDLVDGRYRLVKIGLESIVMAYGDGRGQQTIRMSGS